MTAAEPRASAALGGTLPELPPTRVLEIELASPLPTVTRSDPATGRSYLRARVLVRLHRRPLGLVDVALPEQGLTPGLLAGAIWRALSPEINQHLRDDGLPTVASLDRDGLPVVAPPECAVRRTSAMDGAPFISVVVSTRDRADVLVLCLECLSRQEYPTFEIIVVDNAPATSATFDLVAGAFGGDPRVRYIREDRPGLSRGRNAGLQVAAGEIIAITDDDTVPDPLWLAEIAMAFAQGDRIACVTGPVVAAELETAGQQLFEGFGRLNKGFSARVFDKRRPRGAGRLYPYSGGTFGSGANMSFRTHVLRQMGGFDPALGAGSLARGGEDLAIFVQLINAGHQLAYQPGALLYHVHPRTYRELMQRAYGYGVGLTAYLTKCLVDDPRIAFAVLRRVPAGIAFILDPKSHKNRSKGTSYPQELTRLERSGMVQGPLAYLRSRRRVRRSAAAARAQSRERARGSWRASRSDVHTQVPRLAASMALGLLVVALAFQASWNGAGWAEWAGAGRWAGLLLVVVPVAWRLLSRRATRNERLLVLVLGGIALYFVKVFYSPGWFTFSDELQHWRTAEDILQSGRLFTPNPILPVSPSYPGLESVTTAITTLTGLSILAAGTIVMLAARVIFTVALYGFLEAATSSSRLAGMAALVYTASPTYLFMMAFFTYQGTALALLALALLATARAATPRTRSEGRVAWLAVALASIVGVVISHHVTSLALATFLGLWAFASIVLRRPATETVVTSAMAAVCVALTVGWMRTMAPDTVNYLGKQIGHGVFDLLNLLDRNERVSQVVRLPQRSPFELGIGLSTIAFISALLPFGWWRLWRARRSSTAHPRWTSLVLALGLASMGYYASLALRFASQGSEFVARMWVFLYIPIAFLLALVAAPFVSRRGRWVALACFAFVFVGGNVNGYPPPYSRLPGPWRVAATQRDVGPVSIAAARWTRDVLGDNNTMIGDFTLRHVFGSYGMQAPIYGLEDVYFAPSVGAPQLTELRDAGVQYVLVDRRLARVAPDRGIYFDDEEPQAYVRTQPIAADLLQKFDRSPALDRVYDNGSIAIYHVRRPNDH